MVIHKLLDELIVREGVKDTNNPHDPGGRTKYGISERAHPEAWKNGPPTRQVAEDIFFRMYMVKSGFIYTTPDFLAEQLIDWGVTSGPLLVTMELQRILRVPVDGKIGPITKGALAEQNAEVVNTKVVIAHVLMLGRLVQKRPSQLTFLFGWLTRALSFLRV